MTTQLLLLIPGLYCDRLGSIYVDMPEFLDVHGFSDQPAVRRAVWSEIFESFEGSPIFELYEN